jgi:hypothetical protein
MVYPPTQGVRPKGPRPGSISRARPASLDAPTAQTGSLSQPNLHSSPQPVSTPQPAASVASLPTDAGSGVGLRRSVSSGVQPPRRKPVPSHLPAMTEVSPFPTLLASPKSVPGIPFTAPQTQEEGGPQPSPYAQEGQLDRIGGSADVAPKKELVPLLGVPEGRVAGHEAHYVTKTTKARWDGKPVHSLLFSSDSSDICVHEYRCHV